MAQNIGSLSMDGTSQLANNVELLSGLSCALNCCLACPVVLILVLVASIAQSSSSDSGEFDAFKFKEDCLQVQQFDAKTCANLAQQIESQIHSGQMVPALAIWALLGVVVACMSAVPACGFFGARNGNQCLLTSFMVFNGFAFVLDASNCISSGTHDLGRVISLLLAGCSAYNANGLRNELAAPRVLQQPLLQNPAVEQALRQPPLGVPLPSAPPN
ncbi:unnamed protein product [Polarella glacialis]|uniref:Transmembrane protein n=1 Tax=Polarella glacialis TaxID=89957 RepID=A0A813JIG8_POLGL|nr:unnamed protein product [Polarella glacialis]CAE8678294.1 unnamed protein product [Polarella glacialis]|mmetsp:Transcript_17423/g.30939  ORF Transcript_17423/g.30939 Transcript_17423/m.30939 type:complete len:216 (+) Transcript_17423:51-698(+)